MRLDLLKKDLPNSPNTSLYQAFQLADSQKVKKLDLQQDLLNPIGIDIMNLQQEINRFYDFGLLLVRS